MKYTLLGFFLTAMVTGSRAEASYVCLEASPDLPLCNFHRSSGSPVGSELDKKTKIVRGAVMESLYQAPDNTVVIYKLEGCIPERLPFTLPKCRSEEIMNRVVEIRRLFPFAIAGDPPTAPLIFPKIETARLYKSTGDFHEKTYNPIISRQDLNSNKESLAGLSRRRKKMSMESTLKKNRKHKKLLDTEVIDPSMISTMLLPVFRDSAEQQDAYETKHHRRRNDIDESEEFDKLSRNSEFFDESVPKYVFPYARAIPYGSEKMRIPEEDLNSGEFTKDGSEFPYSRAIPFDPEKHKNLLHQTKGRINHHHHTSRVPKYFPYEKAIPYDPLKLKDLVMWVKNNDDLSNLKLRKREIMKNDDKHWKITEFGRKFASKSRSVIRKRSTSVDHARD